MADVSARAEIVWSDDQHPNGAKRWAWNSRSQRRELATVEEFSGGQFTLRWPDGSLSRGHFRCGLTDQNLDHRAEAP